MAKPIEVEIVYSNSHTGKVDTFIGYKIREEDWLAFHPSVNKPGKGKWSVSLIRGGLQILPEPVSRKVATEIVIRIGGLPCWDIPRQPSLEVALQLIKTLREIEQGAGGGS